MVIHFSVATINLYVCGLENTDEGERGTNCQGCFITRSQAGNLVLGCCC